MTETMIDGLSLNNIVIYVHGIQKEHLLDYQHCILNWFYIFMFHLDLYVNKSHNINAHYK